MAGAIGVEQFRLDGKTALVTGSTKGLGLAMARALASAGADVVINSRNPQEAQAVAESLAAETGRKVTAVAADVATSGDCERLISETVRAMGRLDVLVNNAGINIRKHIQDFADAEWQRIVDVNLSAPFYLCRSAYPHLKRSGRGRVINLGSIMSLVSIPGRSAYAATKSGLVNLTRTLALEWAADRITVNAILPGPFRTPLNDEILLDPEKREYFMQRLPIGRFGEPEEIGALAIYLASDASAFMTGSPILLDGGWTSQ